MRSTTVRTLMIATAAGCLTACGGGGGGGGSAVFSTPTPPPPPPPPPPPVDIFASPATQEFAALGVGDDLRVRYDAASGTYQVMAGSLPWTTLIDDPLSSPGAGTPNTMFKLAGTGDNQSFFTIRAHRDFANSDVQYSYSNIAEWSVGAVASASRLGGVTAFGIATPAGGVPLTGSASYHGFIDGISSVDYQYDVLMVPARIGGSVALDFDFGSGTLAGLIQPYLDTFDHYNLPSLAFSNTVFGAGSTTFSGNFATVLGGPNSFSGRFTGPHAEELIGEWAFPFVSPIDGALESAEGVWIAKKP